MTAEKVGVMITGGLDSTVLLYSLIAQDLDITPIYIYYGQHAFKKESQILSKILPSKLYRNLNIIELSKIYTNSSSRLVNEPDLWTDTINDSDLHLPYRNMLLISSALAFCASNSIGRLYAGFINTNSAKEIDSTQEFLESLQSYANNFDIVEIITPFKDKTKEEIWRLGIELRAPVQLTFSCQARSKTPCGACPNCVERNKSFKILLK